MKHNEDTDCLLYLMWECILEDSTHKPQEKHFYLALVKLIAMYDYWQSCVCLQTLSLPVSFIFLFNHLLHFLFTPSCLGQALFLSICCHLGPLGMLQVEISSRSKYNTWKHTFPQKAWIKSKIYTLQGLNPFSLPSFSRHNFAALKILPRKYTAEWQNKVPYLHLQIEILAFLKLLQSSAKFFSEAHMRRNSLMGRTYQAIQFFHWNPIHPEYQPGGCWFKALGSQ